MAFDSWQIVKAEFSSRVWTQPLTPCCVQICRNDYDDNEIIFPSWIDRNSSWSLIFLNLSIVFVIEANRRRICFENSLSTSLDFFSKSRWLSVVWSLTSAPGFPDNTTTMASVGMFRPLVFFGKKSYFAVKKKTQPDPTRRDATRPAVPQTARSDINLETLFFVF